ncbi:MAG: Transcriptional regulator, AraC family, partial [bacterium]|nr:Transcriptional regulator, AraC family [bacterium]
PTPARGGPVYSFPMHVVAVLALDGVVPFDLATPCEVLGRARLANGRAAYRVEVCGVARTVDAGAFQLRTRRTLRWLRCADTIVVPGVADLERPIPPAVLSSLRAAAARGTRIASICTGAFVLARSGLLDGLRATTHWLVAPELARLHPAVTVDADVLYVDNGAILTSAGAAAGLDLCLHHIRRDFGAAVAADTARISVMPLERDGGQAQFIVHAPPAGDGDSLRPLLDWLGRNLHRALTLRTIARRAAMSTRSLSRRFRAQTGTTPAKWVLALRVRRAQQLLETTAQPVERVAEQAGFGSTAAFRDRFVRLVGTSPQAYRRAFRVTATATLRTPRSR